MILSCFSTGTIGIIDNSEALAERVRDEEDRGIRDRAYRSLGVAGWLIVLSATVLICEAVAIVLVIVNFQRLKLALQLLVSGISLFLINSCINIALSFRRQELVFSFEMVLSYGATGIVCAVFAQQWGHRPAVLCYSPGDCDDDPLTATHSLATVRYSSLG